MDVRELRIGNFVLVNGKITEIENITQQGINIMFFDSIGCPASWAYEAEFSKDKIEGIPLSEEWLLKFGLTIHKLNGDVVIENVIGRYEDFNEDKLYYVISYYANECGDYNYITEEISFVHQLQNLHHILTRQELHIK